MKYQIALSFAGAQQQYVDGVAHRLLELGMEQENLYYYPFHEDEGWGKDGKEHFHEVFSQSHCVVLFISKEYQERKWTKIESKAALGPEAKKHGVYVLPVLLDDSKPIVLHENLLYIHARINKGTPNERFLTSDEMAKKVYNKYRQIMSEDPEVEGNNFMSSISTREVSALHQSGNLKTILGNYEGAIVDYEGSIRQSAKIISGYYKRAGINRSLEFTEEEIRDYDKAIKLSLNIVMTYFALAGIKSNLGKQEEANHYIAEAKETGRKFDYLHYARALANDRLGKLEESVSDIGHAIRLEPERAGYYYARALKMNQLGRKEEAVKDFGKAIRLEPNQAYMYYARAGALSDLGRYEESKKDYDEAVRLEPNQQYIRDARRNVQALLKSRKKRPQKQ